MMGCDTEPLWGFETWAENTGCGKEELAGTLLVLPGHLALYVCCSVRNDK